MWRTDVPKNIYFAHSHTVYVGLAQARPMAQGRKLSRIGGDREQDIRGEKLSRIAWCRHGHCRQLGMGVAVDFRGENFRG